ncbi:MAG: hypothetical protein AAGH68_01025 [Pseudomonadota bacterium]
MDDALARLARDVNAGAPRPDAALVERVTDDAADLLVADGLAALADEVNARAPRPGADLMARVLADAAAVAPAQAHAPTETAPARPRGVMDMLFGWTGGTVAGVSLCLTMGVAVGMEIAPEHMPLMGGETIEVAEVDPMGIMPEDFL